MNRIKVIANSLFIVAFVVGLSAWTASAQQNPFAPQPAPPLPAGMTGSTSKDPRSLLTPGLYDAGQVAMGMRHLKLLPKPDAFQLGTDDPNSVKTKQTLGMIGVSDPSQVAPSMLLAVAQLAFANSDIAFQGNHLFMGNFYGMNIYDISNPANTTLVTSLICPGGQGDVSVFGRLMFMSVEMPNGRVDCGEQGFPPQAPSAAPAPAAEKDRFRGVRIFDISDIRNPRQVGAVQTCRGSHTHTLVVPRDDKENVYIYVSGSSFVRPGAELEGCSGGMPDQNPNTALFRIEVIKVPLAAPEKSEIVSMPRVFGDAETGAISAIDSGGSHATGGKPQPTEHCHDITVYSELGLAAGACAGNGILLDIKDPVNPKRIESVNDTNFAYWHSATFSNDGKKVVFTDEWGGGMGARCRENDPNVWGANALFRLNNNKLEFASYYKLPAAQGDSENCVAHNGSLVPVPGRDIKVQAWYQGGISVMDFTDIEKPMEIAYFDRGAIDPNLLILGGSWSAYWYNGYIYSSEIARGLDVLELTPTRFLTQNELNAAKTVRVGELNVQNQERLVWPRNLTVAKAYVDQLERSRAVPADRIASIRTSIRSAEASRLGQNEVNALRGHGAWLNSNSATVKGDADIFRVQALAEILINPAM